MNEKTQSALGAGLLGFIILGSLIWYMATTPPPGFEVPVPAFVEPEPQTFSETTQYYDIQAVYPSKTPLSASVGVKADTEAVSLMRDFQEETIAEFKRNGGFDSLTPEDIEMFGYDQGRKQALGFEYNTYTSDKTVSYEYSIYADTMGAHPNLYFRTFTFNLNTGDLMTLKDLFPNDPGYLETVSGLSRDSLREQLGEYANTEYLEDGTTPMEVNFQNFVVDGDTLVIIFPPYQVGPYALGVQRVEIPLEN
ncbi:RsiV family protein [Patescibacteria group bacterium]|nr:RsiV family protein [Patescibacteria group bacterium]MBU1755289.1 RsiV family protein [Patescibacteria group bacterium]